jgi:hypothetical protein
MYEMKKLLLFALTLLLVNVVLLAQNIAVLDVNHNDLNGQDLYVNDLHNGEYVVNFLLKNNSNSPVDVIFKKSHIVMQPGGSDYFCVGLTCYLPESMETGTMTIPAGGVMTDTCYVHMMPGTSMDASLVRYTLYNVANPADSSSVIVHYNDELSISTEEEAQVAVYPNPATDHFVLDYKIKQGNGVLTIHNMLGTEVRKINLTNMAGSEYINVSDMNAGVYFYALKRSNKVLHTGRIVIK